MPGEDTAARRLCRSLQSGPDACPRQFLDKRNPRDRSAACGLAGSRSRLRLPVKRTSLLLRQQLLDLGAHDLLALGLAEVQFAVPTVANLALLVDEVDA